MTLEDFFTLTEMNNGLTVPDRVRELVGVIQKENGCFIGNSSDAARQMSAVASAIAATENKDCLDLFAQLDGLVYLNKWLKEASKLWDKSSDSCVEEAITDLLRAFRRLESDSDKFITSGIGMTVKELLGHNCFKVQDMAKSLVSSWNKEKANGAIMQSREVIGTLVNADMGATEKHSGESVNVGSSKGDDNASRGSMTVEEREEAAKDVMLTTTSESFKAEETKNRTLDDAILNKDIPHPTNSSSLSESPNGNLDKSDSPKCSDFTISAEACSSADLKQGVQKGEMYAPELDPTNDARVRGSPKMLEKDKVPMATVTAEDADASHNVVEPGITRNSNAAGKNFSGKVAGCLRPVASEAGSRDDISSNYCKNSTLLRMKEDGECNSDVLQDSDISELKPENLKDSGSLIRRIENVGAVEGDIRDRIEGSLTKDYGFPKPGVRRKDHTIVKKHDLDLDYGIVDPLEVARMVAIEVEREVEDRRERSCSSSEKEFGSKVQQPESPHSVSGEQGQTAQSSPAEAQSQSDLSLDSPSMEDPSTSAGNVDNGDIIMVQDAESSQVSEAAQEVEANMGKGFSHFDLNKEVCSEDVEHQGDIVSPPVSVVSASRAAAAPAMPIAPLHFEGALGWKGSAATSAFRPTSPRRARETESAISAGGSNSSPKPNRGFLNFDLNEAESGDDKMIDLQLEKQVPISSCLRSGEFSVEASVRRSERLELDLNQISGDGAALDLQTEGEHFCQSIGQHSRSPSSSSSSKQPSQRNIDLNDHPAVANDSSTDQFNIKPSHNPFASGSLQSDDSVISIMGMRVEVNRKDSSVRNVLSLDGRTSEPPFDVNLARPFGIFGMGYPAPYAHPHLQGYNGLATGSAMPFSSPVYGPGGSVPYMVDSRGAPIVPQIMTSSALSSSFQQPPYVFSMPSSNGFGPSRNDFDLNSGLFAEGGGRDLGGFRQLFNPPQQRSIDERLKADSQPSSSSGSGIGGKRKESESGWESYPFKHHLQPWR